MRGGQHLTANRNYEAIRTLGRALSRLYKHESRENLIRALYLCGLAYEHVGLLWAARGTTLTAAALATDKFYTYSKINELQARGYSRMKWLELQLGRLPQILSWQELDLLTRATLDDLPEEPNEEDINFNAILGMLLLRANIPQLRQLTTLPDVLEGMRLPMASIALLYALGHDDEIPDELGNETPVAFFQQWLEQPVAKSIPQRPELYDAETANLTSHIAGCRFTVMTSTATPCVDVAESILAAIESLGSTAMVEGAIAREPTLTMRVTLVKETSQLVSFEVTEREGRPHIEVQCAPFHPHKLVPDDQHKVRSAISDLLVHLFARAFLIEDLEATLTKLFRDEEAIGRSINFTSSILVLGNILGDNPTTTLTSWKDRGGKEYPLRREQEWSAALPVAVPEKHGPTFGTGEPPAELLDRQRLKHSDIENISLIRVALWDRAGWNGTAFSVSPDDGDAPVLALLFDDRAAAAAIFAALRKDVGEIDERERLRVSILRGVDKEHPYWYRVVLGTNIPVEELTPDKLVIMTTRSNTMEPQTDKNLNRFLAAYARAGGYFLMPGILSNGRLELIDDDYIAKREINVRYAWEVGRHDPDATGIRADDDLIIPAAHKKDAPVLELLNVLRGRSA